MEFAQIAWVVPDLGAAETFFCGLLGITNFSRVENLCAGDYEGTYYGQPSAAIWHVSIAYAGGSFIELIQPVSGQSIFQDFLEKNPAGGVQHMAYSVPVAEVDAVVSGMEAKGYPVVTSVTMPPARIFFFDTYRETGMMTEIMGITPVGEEYVRQLKHIFPAQ